MRMEDSSRKRERKKKREKMGSSGWCVSGTPGTQGFTVATRRAASAEEGTGQQRAEMADGLEAVALGGSVFAEEGGVTTAKSEGVTSVCQC